MEENIKNFPEPANLLPHRKPFLFIDKIISFKVDEFIETEAYIPEDFVHFNGHFINNPIVPGVLLVEMMFQTSGLYARLSKISGNKVSDKNEMASDGRAIKINNVTFHKEVKPNEYLNILAKPKQHLFGFSTFSVIIKSNGNKVATGDVTVYIKK